MTKGPVLVVGAGEALGMEIVRLLRARGAAVIGAMRTRREAAEQQLKRLGAECRHLDLNDTASLRARLTEAGGAIFTPILTVSGQAARFLSDRHAAVFFSSNNVAIDPQAEVYTKLLAAEKKVRANAPQAVILRPTMIYGHPGDGNLSKLMLAMKRAPFTPMPGRGTALQQPLFYKDLAKAAVEAFFSDKWRGKTSAVAGPDAVTQRALYEAVAEAAGASLQSFSVPTSAAARLLDLIETTGVKLPVSAAQLRRAALDKTPQGGNVVLGETGLKAGLAALARALDERPAGA